MPLLGLLASGHAACNVAQTTHLSELFLSFVCICTCFCAVLYRNASSHVVICFVVAYVGHGNCIVVGCVWKCECTKVGMYVYEGIACMCLYLWSQTHKHKQVCTYITMYVCIRIRIRVCICICICTCICLCMCMCMCMYMYMHMYMYVRVCVHACVCACI